MIAFLKRFFGRYQKQSKLNFIFKELYDIIGFYPKVDEQNYIKALTHSSYSKKLDDKNERLEFLGDAVINYIVAEYLFHQLTNRDEGTLTKYRSYIVNRKQLNRVGLKIGLHVYIRHKFNTKNYYEKSPDIIGNALEALIGAYFLDYGIAITQQIIEKIILNQIELYQLETEIFDYKSSLFEWTQAEKKTLRFHHSSKETHSNLFCVQLYINEEFTTEACGKNKKEAEYLAAKSAVEQLNITPK